MRSPPPFRRARSRRSAAPAPSPAASSTTAETPSGNTAARPCDSAPTRCCPATTPPGPSTTTPGHRKSRRSPAGCKAPEADPARSPPATAPTKGESGKAAPGPPESGVQTAQSAPSDRCPPTRCSPSALAARKRAPPACTVRTAHTRSSSSAGQRQRQGGTADSPAAALHALSHSQMPRGRPGRAPSRSERSCCLAAHPPARPTPAPPRPQSPPLARAVLASAANLCPSGAEQEAPHTQPRPACIRARTAAAVSRAP